MFETPLFLIAAAVGAMVPLILHLLQHRRSVPMAFPTLRFLKLAEKSSSRRIRLENILLWLLRTAIMVLLGLAFALPVLRQRGLRFLGRAPRDLAIVLDASYSMRYQAGRQNVWEKAVETAVDLIEGLESHDRYCLFLAREHPEALVAEPIGDRERGLGFLRSAQPDYDTSRLAPALDAAYGALRRATGRREREIHILTDNQALPWNEFMAPTEAEADGEAADGRWKPDDGDRQTAVFVSLLGVTAPENVAPRNVRVSPALLFAGASAEISVDLARTGPPRDVTVTFYLNEREMGRRAVTAGAMASEAITFTTPPLPVGIHTGRVETPDDALSVDNVFHFLLRVRDRLPLLGVGEEQDVVFLRSAFRAAAARGSGLDADWIVPDRLDDEPLGAYACVFLCNALPVSGQALEALEHYVEAGGLLVLFPGGRAGVDAYRVWNSLPGVPSEIREVPRIERARTLTWDLPGHTALRSLRDGLAIPRFTLQRALQWTDRHEDTRQLVSAGPGQPFLLERPFGRGRVMMFAVSANRDWSTFPLSPYYLPLMMQIVEHGAGLGGQTPFVWASDRLPLGSLLPGADRGTRILDPDSEPVALGATSVAGRSHWYARDVLTPGVYTQADPNGAPGTPVWAVNFPREESDLTPLPSERLADLLDADPLYLASDRETLRRLLHEHRVGRSLGEHLLWLVLLLLAVEFFYANRLLRARPSLSYRLGIKTSGKVGGGAAPARGGNPA